MNEKESAREDAIEQAYWEMLARRNGESQWKGMPQSERDAFKCVVRGLLSLFAPNIDALTHAAKEAVDTVTLEPLNSGKKDLDATWLLELCKDALKEAGCGEGVAEELPLVVRRLANQVEAQRLALQVIADYPTPEAGNMPAENMKALAVRALKNT